MILLIEACKKCLSNVIFPPVATYIQPIGGIFIPFYEAFPPA